MNKWTRDVLAAAPRRIGASGGISIPADGEPMHHVQRWSEVVHASGLPKRSVEAEPEGIARLVMRFIRPAERLTLRVLTDNSAAVGALNKGHSPAFLLNAICDRIATNFPFLTLAVEHLPGARNPSDGISRGKPLTVGEWATALALAKEEPRTRVVNGGAGPSRCVPT